MKDIKNIKEEFPILSKKIHDYPLVYLDNAATTQKPQSVIDSITSFYTTMNGNVHRGAHTLGEQASHAFESIRTQVQVFLNARESSEIIFTSGTTESINLIAACFGDVNIEAGDEIIITEMEHHANIVPWQILCEKKHATLKYIPVQDDGTLDISQVSTLITKKTKLISLCYVSNVLGTINPITEIIDLAHAEQIPVLIDAAQAIQHMPIDVQMLDCDFLVFSGHKIYAETGVGILYAKKKWLTTIPPYKYGGGMISQVTLDQSSFTEPPYKFEAGTSNISAVISLGAALTFIDEIGIDSIQQHEQNIFDYALEQLQNIDGITLYGNPDHQCSIISFTIEGIHHLDVVKILDSLGIAVRSGSHCAQPLMQRYQLSGTIRISLACYTTINDIDRLIEGLKKIQEMIKEPCPKM